MNKRASKRILGMTQTQLLILGAMGGLLLCAIVLFGGYMIFALRGPLPAAVPPISLPAQVTQAPANTQSPVRPTGTATLIPKPMSRPTFTAIPTATSFVIPTLNSPTPIPTATTTPTATRPSVSIDSLIANLSKCEKIIYETYWLVVRYPKTWGCDKRENSIKSTGAGGFMNISLKGGSRLAKEFCERQIRDQDRYGAHPTLEILQVDGQPACLILPSNDQESKYQKAALLVVNYPQTVRKGMILLISADKYHIRSFASSLRFTPPPTTPTSTP